MWGIESVVDRSLLLLHLGNNPAPGSPSYQDRPGLRDQGIVMASEDAASRALARHLADIAASEEGKEEGFLSNNAAGAAGDTAPSFTMASMTDMKCTKCSWTLFTGGMSEEGHAALEHGPLVPDGPVVDESADSEAPAAAAGAVSFDAMMGDDKKCTQCGWTLFTGGMDESAHEALGHGPLEVVKGGAPS